MKKIRVVRVKIDQVEKCNKQYLQELMKEDFVPYSIPVLEFEFTNLDILVQCLQSCGDFSAVVFTSQRVVEAASEAARTLEGTQTGFSELHSLFVRDEVSRNYAYSQHFMLISTKSEYVVTIHLKCLD